MPAWRSQEDMVDASLAAVWVGCAMPGGKKKEKACVGRRRAPATTRGTPKAGALLTAPVDDMAEFDRDERLGASDARGDRPLRPRGDRRARVAPRLARHGARDGYPLAAPKSRRSWKRCSTRGANRSSSPPPTPPTPCTSSPRAARGSHRPARGGPEIDERRALAGDVTGFVVRALTQKIDPSPSWSNLPVRHDSRPMVRPTRRLRGSTSASAWLIALDPRHGGRPLGAYFVLFTTFFGASSARLMRVPSPAPPRAWVSWCLPCNPLVVSYGSALSARFRWVSQWSEALGRDDDVARVVKVIGLMGRRSGTPANCTMQPDAHL